MFGRTDDLGPQRFKRYRQDAVKTGSYSRDYKSARIGEGYGGPTQLQDFRRLDQANSITPSDFTSFNQSHHYDRTKYQDNLVTPPDLRRFNQTESITHAEFRNFDQTKPMTLGLQRFDQAHNFERSGLPPNFRNSDHPDRLDPFDKRTTSQVNTRILDYQANNERASRQPILDLYSIKPAPGHQSSSVIPNRRPTHILHLTIFNCLHSITIDVLRRICTVEGVHVLRIVICDQLRESKIVTGMVEFDSVTSAERVCRIIDGSDIFRDSCTIKTTYAETERLNVPVNNEEMWDFTQDIKSKAAEIEEARLRLLERIKERDLKRNAERGVINSRPWERDQRSVVNDQFRSISGMSQRRVDMFQFGHDQFQRDQVYEEQVTPLSISQRFHDTFISGKVNSHVDNPVDPRLFHNQHHEEQFLIPPHEVKTLLLQNLKMSRMNCDRLFNLFCQYGNVTRIKFSSFEANGSHKGTAFVEMSDSKSASVAALNLDGCKLFSKKCKVRKVRNFEKIDTPSKVEYLLDSSPSFKAFGMDRTFKLNRFITQEAKSKACFTPPKEVVHFFSCPPDFTHEELIDALTGVHADAPVPTGIFFFPKQTKSNLSKGLVKYADVEDATNALVICNNLKVDTGKSYFTLKLAFSITAFPDEAKIKNQPHLKTPSIPSELSNVVLPEGQSTVDPVTAAVMKAAIRKVGTNVNNTAVPNVVPEYTGGSTVVVINNLSRNKVNCDTVFNLVCQYGNVLRIKFPGLKDNVLIEMSDKKFAASVVKNLNDFVLFDKKLKVKISPTHSGVIQLNDFDEGTPANVMKLPDGTAGFSDFSGNPLNRFHDPKYDVTDASMPSPLLFFYQCGSYMTEQDIEQFIVKHGGVIPTAIRIFVQKSDSKTRNGLVRFTNATVATEILMKCNHLPMTNPQTYQKHIFRLRYSKTAPETHLEKSKIYKSMISSYTSKPKLNIDKPNEKSVSVSDEEIPDVISIVDEDEPIETIVLSESDED